MYKIIGGDQKEYGPVTADELRQWIAEGRLNGRSLAQAEGGAWQPLVIFPEFADALTAQAGQAALAGAAVSELTPEAWAAQVQARQPEIDLGSCLGRSWDLLTNNFGLLFGTTALVWLLDLVMQFTPFIGPIVQWLLKGVLYGGLSLVFLKRIRNQPASVNDAFAGFTGSFGQLVLAGMLTSLISRISLCCFVLPGLYLAVAWVFSAPLVADKRLEFWSAMELSRKRVTRVWFPMLGLMVVAFLPSILTYIYAEIRISASFYPFAREFFGSSAPDFSRFMATALEVAKQSLPLIFLIKIVFLLNLPFALGALMYAYEDLFGTRTAPRA